MQEMELSKQALDARREYQRQWRAANPDKVRERNRRYWERRAARMAAEAQDEQKKDRD